MYLPIFFAYRTLNALLKKNSYSFVHCHTPIAAAIARLSCWSLRIPVIYTAHGFQFFKGGPKKDWLLYFPVEWLLSWVTTILITINREDYSLSKKVLHANRTEYIPGVGLDIKKFSECYVDRIEKRTMLGLPENSIVLLSVGELSSRKNQAVVIKALKEINDKNIYYLLAGKGELYSYYDNLRKSLGIERQVILLGLRKDVAELYKISDIFIHPSIREGLGMAPLEAMASGLPLICSYINGIKDYVVDGKTGYCIKNPSDIREIKEAIIKMAADTTYRAACGRYNQECIKKFDIAKSMDCMRKIYLSIR